MTAATEARNTQKLTVPREWRTFPVAAATVILAGTLVAVNASGYLVPASADTTLLVVGVAEEGADNTSGANGALEVEVDRCIAKFVNGDSITIAHVGDPCYATDNQTIAKGDGGTAAAKDATLTFNGTDDVGLYVDGVLVYVACDTNAATTIDNWLVAAAKFPQLTEKFTFTDGTTKITVTKKTSGDFSIEDYSPATASFAISSVTAGVAPTKPRAGKIHLVDSDGVWVDTRA
ncbi:MAG: hypothetical protein EKK62_16410 [Acidimicrobiia bacterium]|nr:MAG: hypothetical protein EKK62_16410 [Acidimicrobiia bacterium]